MGVSLPRRHRHRQWSPLCCRSFYMPCAELKGGGTDTSCCTVVPWCEHRGAQPSGMVEDNQLEGDSPDGSDDESVSRRFEVGR